MANVSTVNYAMSSDSAFSYVCPMSEAYYSTVNDSRVNYMWPMSVRLITQCPVTVRLVMSVQ